MYTFRTDDYVCVVSRSKVERLIRSDIFLSRHKIRYDQHEHVINIVRVINIDQNISIWEMMKSTCVDVQFVI